MSDPNNQNSNSDSVPFFARYLENQIIEDLSKQETEKIGGGFSLSNIAVTMKYPSDGDDMHQTWMTRKYPSDHEDQIDAYEDREEYWKFLQAKIKDFRKNS